MALMTLQEAIQKIIEYSTAYYETGTSPVSDADFDTLIEWVKTQDPELPILKETGWGYKVKDGVEHKYHEITGIPAKFKNHEDVKKFLTKYPKASWSIMPKLDGASVVCYYNMGRLTSCITRGDGIRGRDVTRNLMHRVPLKFANTMRDLEFSGYVRCEVVVSLENFKKHFPVSAKSARNSATGLMGALTPDMNLLQYLDVIPVSIYSAVWNSFVDLRSSMGTNIIEKEQWPLLSEIIVQEDFTEFLTQNIMNNLIDRIGAHYLCDGLVIKMVNSDIKFAYKFDDETKIVEVEKVEWNPVDTGKLFPRVLYAPTEISGCTSVKASGKSYQFIIDNKVNTGAKITLVRGGEIIPDIENVLSPSNVPHNIRCSYGCDPNCLEIVGAFIYCKDPKCPATVRGMFIRLLDTFAPKGFSDEMREEIMKTHGYNVFNFLNYAQNYAKNQLTTYSINSIINAQYTQLTQHGIKLTLQLLNNLTQWKLTLAQLASISIIEQFGKSQSREIESHAASGEELTTWCKEATSVPEEYIINSTAIANWFKRHEIIKAFLKYFNLTVPTKKEIKNCKGVVCITGKLEGVTKARFNELYISSRGYQWTESLTGANILISADGKESGKVKTAKKQGIKIVSVEDWVKNYH
jgi:NAD-dependent DNA ligase